MLFRSAERERTCISCTAAARRKKINTRKGAPIPTIFAMHIFVVYLPSSRAQEYVHIKLGGSHDEMVGGAPQDAEREGG